MIMITEVLQEKDDFRTADLALATVISLSYPIDAIDRQNRQKSTFIFKRQEGLDQLIEGYWRGELRIDPQRFFTQLRAVKARLYGEN